MTSWVGDVDSAVWICFRCFSGGRVKQALFSTYCLYSTVKPGTSMQPVNSFCSACFQGSSAHAQVVLPQCHEKSALTCEMKIYHGYIAMSYTAQMHKGVLIQLRVSNSELFLWLKNEEITYNILFNNKVDCFMQFEKHSYTVFIM